MSELRPEDIFEAEYARELEDLELEKTHFLKDMEKMSMAKRALRGLPPEPQDAFSNLINVKEYLERTRFPTFNILKLVNYLEIGYIIYGEKARILKQAAEKLGSSLISYPKGEGRKEWVSVQQRAVGPGQSIFFGPPFQQQTQPERKRRFWERKKPQSQGEVFRE